MTTCDKGRRKVYTAAVATIIACAAGRSNAATEARWLDAVGGDWYDAAKWSTAPNFPRNGAPAGAQYDVLINATGSPFAVTASNIYVDSLTLDSPDATFHKQNPFTLEGSTVSREVRLLQGTFRASGGAISTPTFYTAAAARMVVDSPGGFIVNAGAFTANATIENHARLVIGPSTTNLAGTIRMTSGDNADDTVLVFSGTSIGGAAEILFQGTGTGNRNFISLPNIKDDAITFGSGITFRTDGQGARIGELRQKVVIQGTVVSETSGRSITFGGTSTANYGTFIARDGGTLDAKHLANHGQISVSNGGTLILDGAWSNAGTIRASAGTVVLRGTFDPSMLGDYVNQGGTTVIEGNFNNVGNLALSPETTGDLVLGNRGFVSHAHLTSTNGARVRVAAHTDNTPYLFDTILDAPLDIPDWGMVEVTGDGVFHKPVTLAGGSNGAQLTFSGGRQSGWGEIVFEGTTDRNVAYARNAGAGPTTIAYGFVIRTGARGGVLGGDSSAKVVNEGTISSQTAGRAIVIRPGEFVNSGLVEATRGGTLTLTTKWSNDGVIRVDNGTLNLGGSFTLAGIGTIERNNATVNLTGTLDNTGGTLDPATVTKGSLALLDGAKIVGGVYATQGGDFLTAPSGSSTIDGVTLRAPLSVTGGSLTLQNGWDNHSTITVSAGSLNIGTGSTTAKIGTILRTGTGVVNVTGTLDNSGANLALDGGTGNWTLTDSAKIVGGTMSASGGAKWILTDKFSSPRYTFDGVTLAGPLEFRTGVLTVQNGLTLDAGTLSIGATGFSGGQIAFAGTQTVGGTGEIVFAGMSFSGVAGILSTSGTLTIGSGVTIRTGFSSATIGTINRPLTNLGRFSAADNFGNAMQINASIFTNDGTVEAKQDASISINATLAGTGTLLAQPRGTVTINRGTQGALDVRGTIALRAKSSGGGTLVTRTLDIAKTGDSWSGRLDLSDNALALDYATPSPLTTTADQIRSAYAGGAWTGKGITTSKAGTRFALGYAEASDLLGLTGDQTATWLGQAVDATTLLVRYTLAGDANLDGSVAFADLLALAKNYNTPATAQWTQGDFNYDGAINFADLLTLAKNYNGALPADSLPGAPAALSADLARAFAPVPEPSLGGLILAAGIGTSLGRRRRRV